MGNTKSKPLPLPSGFSKLPTEIRLMIWQRAADDWIVHHVDFMLMWTVNGKRVFLIHIDTDTKYPKDDSGNSLWHLGFTMEMPPLLFVSREARGVMYDALLNFETSTGKAPMDKSSAYEQVARGEDVQMFLKDGCSHANHWGIPQAFGWRIHDFGYPGLSDRVKEEEDRLMQMGKELMQVRQKMVVDTAQAPEGYVRLPLTHPAGSTKVVVEGDRRREIRLYPWRQKTTNRINHPFRDQDND